MKFGNIINKQLQLFWEEYLLMINPEIYPVDLNGAVWNTKMNEINWYKA
jgi:nicotinate phosphoribosyltransferase